MAEQQQHPFDHLARALAQPQSRRSLLRTLGAGLAAATVGSLLPQMGKNATALSCAPQLTSCGGTCVSLQNDPKNCGSCGHVITPGSQCINGLAVNGPSAPPQQPALLVVTAPGSASADPNASDCGDGNMLNQATGQCIPSNGPPSSPNGAPPTSNSVSGACAPACVAPAVCVGSHCVCPSGVNVCPGPNGGCCAPGVPCCADGCAPNACSFCQGGTGASKPLCDVGQCCTTINGSPGCATCVAGTCCTGDGSNCTGTICGANCCKSSETCDTNNVCRPCPQAQICGNTCCSSAQCCVGGVCVTCPSGSCCDRSSPGNQTCAGVPCAGNCCTNGLGCVDLGGFGKICTTINACAHDFECTDKLGPCSTCTKQNPNDATGVCTQLTGTVCGRVCCLSGSCCADPTNSVCDTPSCSRLGAGSCCINGMCTNCPEGTCCDPSSHTCSGTLHGNICCAAGQCFDGNVCIDAAACPTGCCTNGTCGCQSGLCCAAGQCFSTETINQNCLTNVNGVCTSCAAAGLCCQNGTCVSQCANGCCQNGTCQPGNTAQACGTGGGVCAACASGQSCATSGQFAGQCVCTSTSAPPVNGRCGTGCIQSCPAGQCWDPGFQRCFSACGSGHICCGGVCYDSNAFSCAGGQPVANAGYIKCGDCGGFCHNSSAAQNVICCGAPLFQCCDTNHAFGICCPSGCCNA